jgi:hypothetical protein
VVVFASIRRGEAAAFVSASLVVFTELLAAVVPAAFTWLAVPAAAVEEARSALLTEGVFRDVAALRWAALLTPNLICAEEDWLIVSAAPEIKQIAMNLLVFIIPVFNCWKICLSLYQPSPGIVTPMEVKKIPFPFLGNRSRIRKGVP